MQSPPPSRSPGTQWGQRSCEPLGVPGSTWGTGECCYLDDGSRQDDVSAERTLRIEALLLAVIGLGQRHGQGRLGVRLGVKGHALLITHMRHLISKNILY